ncbi:MAG: PASTA domain-containing protein [Muribaculaceae bacterium]|nr:PASTA domain-containing protein [Muribaculaceae bacterium]
MNDFISYIRRFFKNHPIIANLLVMFIVAWLIVWGVLLFLDSWTHHGSTSTVPQVKGMTYQQAMLVLAENDLTVEISDSIYDRNARPGTIIESWPRAGAVVKQGRQVYVTITAFSPKQVTVSMPVIGVSSRQAVSYLEALGVTSIRLVSVPSQYPDLVENAYADGKPLTVGASFPVTASVTLEVGSAPIDTYPTDSLDEAVDEVIDEVYSGNSDF